MSEPAPLASGLEQILGAADNLHRLSPHEEQRLRKAVETQRSQGAIQPKRIRWLTAERLTRLMDR